MYVQIDIEYFLHTLALVHIQNTRKITKYLLFYNSNYQRLQHKISIIRDIKVKRNKKSLQYTILHLCILRRIIRVSKKNTLLYINKISNENYKIGHFDHSSVNASESASLSKIVSTRKPENVFRTLCLKPHAN